MTTAPASSAAAATATTGRRPTLAPMAGTARAYGTAGPFLLPRCQPRGGTPGSMRKQRPADATATIFFDRGTLVDGAANFPFPAPFIRVDTEK